MSENEGNAESPQVQEPQGGDWLADYLDWKAENGMWCDGPGPHPGEDSAT